MSLIPRELIAFAFVEDEYSRTGDIARGLLPLFRPILAKKPNSIFDPKWFAGEVEQVYDIPMSPIVAEGMVARLTDIGMLYQEDKDSHLFRISPHQKNGSALQASDFDNLLQTFVNFSLDALKRANFDISIDIIESALLKRFTSLQFLTVLGRPDRNYFKGNTLSLKKDDEEDHEAISQEQILDIICADFALQMLETNKENFELLTKIASGALIAEVVLTLQTLSPDQKLENVTLLIDGPLILDILDLSTVELGEFAKDLFELIDKLQIKKAVLNHTVDEMRGTILAPLEMLQRDQLPFGPLGDRIRTNPQHAAYARSIYDGLEDELQKLNIEVIEYEKYTSDQGLEVCSEETEEGLRNVVGRAHLNLERRIKDAQSISTVMRMRGANHIHPRSIVDAISLLVTRNEAVAKASRSYLIFRKDIYEHDFPPSLTDRQLAGLLWFSAGGNLAAISSKKLIANCSNVMHPRTDIVSKLRQCLSEIDPAKAEIFTLLMRDGRAQRCLVQSTFGFPSIITTNNAEDLLESIRNATASKVLLEAQQREEELKSLYDEKIQNLNSVHMDDILEGEATITQLSFKQKQLEEDLRKQNESHTRAIQMLTGNFDRFNENYNQDIDTRFETAREKASKAYNLIKLSLILLYVVLIVLIFAYGPVNIYWNFALNTIITIAGYWIIPDILYKPIGSYAWKKTFDNQIKILNLTDKVKNYSIDYEHMIIKKLK